jgi:hypothetical protein
LKTAKEALEEKAAQNAALERTIETLKLDMSILKQEKQCIVDMTMELCEAADKLKYFLFKRSHETWQYQRRREYGRGMSWRGCCIPCCYYVLFDK